jgi:hypothetical protein
MEMLSLARMEMHLYLYHGWKFYIYCIRDGNVNSPHIRDGNAISTYIKDGSTISTRIRDGNTISSYIRDRDGNAISTYIWNGNAIYGAHKKRLITKQPKLKMTHHETTQAQNGQSTKRLKAQNGPSSK